jgi:hypothetical protein
MDPRHIDYEGRAKRRRPWILLLIVLAALTGCALGRYAKDHGWP